MESPFTEPEAGRWYLYIATPLKEQGPKAAYHQLNRIRREMPEELALHIAGVKLVGPDDPVTRKVLEAPRGKSGRNRLHFGEGGSASVALTWRRRICIRWKECRRS